MAANSKAGLTLRLYRGDRSMVIAYNLDQALTDKLAGFSIKVTSPDGQSGYIKNRLSFGNVITAQTTAAEHESLRTTSDVAPFQKFRWTYFPPTVQKGKYTVDVTALYFNDPAQPSNLRQGATATQTVELDPVVPDFANFELGFTAGYLSSQYYAEKFNNAPFEPSPATMDFDTQPYQAQYEMLGAHAREMIFRLLNETVSDPSLSLDVFAYDFNEPDVIRQLQKLGSRLRIILDNSAEHVKAGALEINGLAAMRASAGADHVVVGHFKRFAHDKIMIQKRNGQPTKVLTGSANFSVRGLYVQANNVAVFNDASVAQLYDQVFESVFSAMSKFSSTSQSQQWFNFSQQGIPGFSVSFAPHHDPNVSLSVVDTAIKQAKSSVLYAVMELSGGGSVMQDLVDLPSRNDIFSYGVVQQQSGGLIVQKPGQTEGERVDFAFLQGKVPEPFRAEYGGGEGQVIHHKFVVVDFNGDKPIAFAGSSNLAAGGESENGDNLYSFSDPGIVTAFAVEALRLFDHYQFRAAWKKASDDQPLTLSTDQQHPWWQAYYTSGDMHAYDRQLFAPDQPS